MACSVPSLVGKRELAITYVLENDDIKKEIETYVQKFHFVPKNLVFTHLFINVFKKFENYCLEREDEIDVEAILAFGSDVFEQLLQWIFYQLQFFNMDDVKIFLNCFRYIYWNEMGKIEYAMTAQNILYRAPVSRAQMHKLLYVNLTILNYFNQRHKKRILKFLSKYGMCNEFHMVRVWFNEYRRRTRNIEGSIESPDQSRLSDNTLCTSEDDESTYETIYDEPNQINKNSKQTNNKSKSRSKKNRKSSNSPVHYNVSYHRNSNEPNNEKQIPMILRDNKVVYEYIWKLNTEPVRVALMTHLLKNRSKHSVHFFFKLETQSQEQLLRLIPQDFLSNLFEEVLYFGQYDYFFKNLTSCYVYSKIWTDFKELAAKFMATYQGVRPWRRFCYQMWIMKFWTFTSTELKDYVLEHPELPYLMNRLENLPDTSVLTMMVSLHAGEYHAFKIMSSIEGQQVLLKLILKGHWFLIWNLLGDDFYEDPKFYCISEQIMVVYGISPMYMRNLRWLERIDFSI